MALVGIAIISLTILKASYAYKTKFNKKITIDKKFERVVGNKHGTTQVYCVSTTDGEIYQLSKSIWYWQFYSAEMWTSLKKGHTYEITGYGWRQGFLSLYPNIVKIKEIEKGL